MEILQTMPWPEQETDKNIKIMYFRNEKDKFSHFDNGIFYLGNGQSLSFSTYFGALSLSTWCHTAKVDNLIVRLKVSGKCSVRIIHAGPEDFSEVLSETIHHISNGSSSSSSDWIEILLEGFHGTTGILYPEITALEDNVVISGLEYATHAKPRNIVRLALIMTTYKRETYVRKNIEKISVLLKEFREDMALFVIDNGQTLGDRSPFDNIYIINNRNFGGSGGFTRGLLEAMDSSGDFTHFLFCDDDIELETESIRRTFKLWQYLDEKSVLGGAMLRMKDMVRMPEILGIGSWMDPTTGLFQISQTSSGKSHLDSREKEDLIQYDLPQKTNYFGWWFFSFSRFVVNQVGLPLPLFVRSDDVEYGFRCQSHGLNFVTLLGVGVWHEDFTYKRLSLVMEFYGLRNKRIITLLHGTHSNENYILLSVLKNIFKNLLSLRYKKALMHMMAFSEVLKGPERLMNVFRNAWEFHAFLEKELNLEIVESSFLTSPIGNYSLIEKLFIIITLNGHIIPTAFFNKNENPIVLDYEHTRIFDSFRKRKVIYRDSFTGKGYVCNHDKKIFFTILFRAVILFFKGILALPFLRKKYRRAFPVMKGENYWRDVLEKKPFSSSSEFLQPQTSGCHENFSGL